MNSDHSAKLDDRISNLRDRVAAHPLDGVAWQHLGFALHQSGSHEDAVRSFERAVAVKASARVQALPHALSLSALHRHDEAIALLEPLRARKPKDFDLANLMGVMLKRAGRFEQALGMFELARKLRPRLVSAWVNMGNVHEAMGNFQAAADAFGQAARLEPRNAELWRLQGASLFRQGRTEPALQALGRAASLAPGDPASFRTHVQVLAKLGRHDEVAAAIECFRAARPGDPEPAIMLARIRHNEGRIDEARKLLAEVLTADPGHLSANLLLAQTCGDGTAESSRRMANDALRRALAANPDAWQAAERLVDSLSRSRYGSEAEHLEAAYAVACDLQDRHPERRLETARTLRTVFTRLLDMERMAATGRLGEILPVWQAQGKIAAVHYELGQVQSMADRVELVEWHRQWGRGVIGGVRPVTHSAVPAVASRRKLRVGFMSSDLRNHPVGYFAYPLLSRYDRDRFDVYCYSFYEGSPSPAQAQIGKQVTGYRWWPGRASEQVAEGIAADGLDILFELGGSTAMNKLDVMAYRPARIGASWLGYPHSAGLETIDYIVVDPYILPPDPRLLIERPFELPETWVVVGRNNFSDVAIEGGLPEDRRGRLTFGTANNPYKITEACLDCWAAVLRRVPGSHFLFLRPEAATPSFKANARAAFAARNVDPGRLDFIGVRGTHLQHYNEIDIALDSLPHVGGTTTCEALWMGVPTISLVGPGFPERLSYSNLSNAGLGDLAVFSTDDYVEQAARLAEDRTRRLALRHGLRDMIAANPLGQADRFVHNFYRKIEEVVLS
ncbi:tetratricopeptide repeat protein [Desulfomicrobium sp. ZS1]|uniref:tetratricopeptide repeat protein n=1 Tax=Desulfomicrobium sp. ZS1 TaxID=2952228 RepID=UPI0020B2646A|nr:tetratricopeptide repeat protein [Desulfomicrobium sp. ZS1]UTF48802.1 tetratricopeptide repeat protein [Desulfomicrobium sp. ZS1]